MKSIGQWINEMFEKYAAIDPDEGFSVRLSADEDLPPVPGTGYERIYASPESARSHLLSYLDRGGDVSLALEWLSKVHPITLQEIVEISSLSREVRGYRRKQIASEEPR